MRLKNISVLILSGMTVAGCHEKSSLPYYNTPDMTPVWNNGNNGHSMHTVPAFAFTDQGNHALTEKNVSGKIYVAGFFFTSCGVVCPKMTTNLLKVQQAFTNEPVDFVLHTVTPWIDSSSRLRSYAQKYHMNDHWHLVTGNTGSIYKMARQGYFAEEEPGFQKDSTEFLHTEHLLLIDKNRHIRGVYNGTLPLEAERLIADIHLLLQEG